MNKKILLIDDEGDLLEMLVLLLSQAGYHVDIAMDGEAGVNKALTFLPDLIVLDLIMPKMNGYEVSRRIRQEEAIKEVPILLLTAASQPEIDDEARKAGSNDVMRKPYQNAHFMDVINNMIRVH